MEAIAPTLTYNAAIMGDSTVPPDMVSAVKAPTLVLHGSGTETWAANATQALTAALPNAQRRTREGQTHNVAWEVLAPEVRGSSRSDDRRSRVGTRPKLRKVSHS
jgi:hypothetical protein